jgi:hypothetical protein
LVDGPLVVLGEHGAEFLALGLGGERVAFDLAGSLVTPGAQGEVFISLAASLAEDEILRVVIGGFQGLALEGRVKLLGRKDVPHHGGDGGQPAGAKAPGGDIAPKVVGRRHG